MAKRKKSSSTLRRSCGAMAAHMALLEQYGRQCAAEHDRLMREVSEEVALAIGVRQVSEGRFPVDRVPVG